MKTMWQPAGQYPIECTHATREEYETFLRQRLSVDHPRHQLHAYTRFVAEYPELNEWFRAPLADRVGCLRGESTKTYSARARPYLYFLALRGYARFDWEWIIAVRQHRLCTDLLEPRMAKGMESLVETAADLGYASIYAREKLGRVLKCLYLHLPTPDVDAIGETEIDEFAGALRAFGDRQDLNLFFGSPERHRKALRSYRSELHLLRVVLYHRGRIAVEPRRGRRVPPPPPAPRARMEVVIERYLRARRAQGARPATIAKFGWVLRRFSSWVAGEHEELMSFSEVTREHVLEYSLALDASISTQTGRPLTLETKLSRLANLSVFFQDVAAWGWEDAPTRPLLGARDLPKRPVRIPKYIPEEELSRLMEAIRELPCSYQRAALLIARWCGARRGEIRNLELDCLDSYPDGTPRLRIPVGKSKSERIVPLNEEAATAIRDLQTLARDGRGFRDEQTGVEARRLFVHRGQRYSSSYLFEDALEESCRVAGLVTMDGKPTVNAHRFRHTVATELAESGARLHTIMKMLGHTSVEMTMVYAQISDREVLRDYQKVLGPGAEIAGPLAATLRSGELPASDVEWIKNNFFKTELELGHCLRLPQEGPCECDLYLSCAKFVTNREYAPRLRARRLKESELIENAVSNGWEREAERHRCTAKRLEQLLEELGEPLEPRDGTLEVST